MKIYIIKDLFFFKKCKIVILFDRPNNSCENIADKKYYPKINPILVQRSQINVEK